MCFTLNRLFIPRIPCLFRRRNRSEISEIVNVKCIGYLGGLYVSLVCVYRGVHRVLVNRKEGRSRRMWKDDIKRDLKEVDYNDSNWRDSAQDRSRHVPAMYGQILSLPVSYVTRDKK